MTDPHKSYENAQIANLNGADPRFVEAWSLAQVALRLERAYGNGNADLSDVIDAVRLNWRIWTIIQSYLVDEECALPYELRENLLSLTGFMDKQSVRIIGRKDLSSIPTLININRQISAGLFSDPHAPQGSQDSEEDQKAITESDPPATESDSSATTESENPPMKTPLPQKPYDFVRIKGGVR